MDGAGLPAGLPSIEQVFVMEDWPDFGADYGRTLMDRHASFDQHLRCM